MKRLTFVIIAFAGIVLQLSCSNVNNAGGGSSTGNANTIAGLCVEPGGIKPALCKVYVYRADGVPSSRTAIDTNIVSFTTTNNGGRYRIGDIPDGTYNIYFADSAKSIAKLRVNATISGSDSIFTGIDTLHFTAALSGRVNSSSGGTAIAFIYGSPFIASVNDTSGYFYLNRLPSGDSLTVTFLSNGTGKTCSARYSFGYLPDTTRFISVEMECR